MKQNNTAAQNDTAAEIPKGIYRTAEAKPSPPALPAVPAQDKPEEDYVKVHGQGGNTITITYNADVAEMRSVRRQISKILSK